MMGEDPATVHWTGCPSIDLAAEILPRSELDFDPMQKYGGVGAPLDLSKGYMVVMQHPVTTEYQLARSHVLETLHAVHELGLPTLWFWPNVDAGSDGTSTGVRSFRENIAPKNIHFFKNMEPQDFLRLVYNARCLVGNSSVGIRECSFLGVPVVNIGIRQGGRERGENVLDVGYTRDEIRTAIERQVGHGRYPSDVTYGEGNAGSRIAGLLAEAPLRIEKRLMY
jgi:UDP-hydrolysing UDP-N-acetyl-D-glucosamine 2-epimerase